MFHTMRVREGGLRGTTTPKIRWMITNRTVKPENIEGSSLDCQDKMHRHYDSGTMYYGLFRVQKTSLHIGADLSWNATNYFSDMWTLRMPAGPFNFFSTLLRPVQEQPFSRRVQYSTMSDLPHDGTSVLDCKCTNLYAKCTRHPVGW